MWDQSRLWGRTLLLLPSKLFIQRSRSSSLRAGMGSLTRASLTLFRTSSESSIVSFILQRDQVQRLVLRLNYRLPYAKTYGSLAEIPETSNIKSMTCAFILSLRICLSESFLVSAAFSVKRAHSSVDWFNSFSWVEIFAARTLEQHSVSKVVRFSRILWFHLLIWFTFVFKTVWKLLIRFRNWWVCVRCLPRIWSNHLPALKKSKISSSLKSLLREKGRDFAVNMSSASLTNRIPWIPLGS